MDSTAESPAIGRILPPELRLVIAVAQARGLRVTSTMEECGQFDPDARWNPGIQCFEAECWWAAPQERGADVNDYLRDPLNDDAEAWRLMVEGRITINFPRAVGASAEAVWRSPDVALGGYVAGPPNEAVCLAFLAMHGVPWPPEYHDRKHHPQQEPAPCRT